MQWYMELSNAWLPGGDVIMFAQVHAKHRHSWMSADMQQYHAQPVLYTLNTISWIIGTYTHTHTHTHTHTTTTPTRTHARTHAHSVTPSPNFSGSHYLNHQPLPLTHDTAAAGQCLHSPRRLQCTKEQILQKTYRWGPHLEWGEL